MNLLSTSTVDAVVPSVTAEPTPEIGARSSVTQYQADSLALLSEISANVAELASWVAVSAFASSFACGLLVLVVILNGKDQGKV